MSNKKAPWEDERTPWKTKASFMSYIRGCLRKAWGTHPVKLSVLKNKRQQVPNPNPRGNKATVWGFECSLCKNKDIIKHAQVDHIEPAGSLKDVSDIQGFAERLLVVCEEDLRLVCKQCNSALAYADKHGISYDEAIIVKKAIDIQKGDDKVWLSDNGITPTSNTQGRRKQIIEVLTKITQGV